MKLNPENFIELYVYSDLSGGWNQEEGKDTVSVISRMGYVISYAKFWIIWASRLQTEIVLIKMKPEYISLSQAMRGVLPFVSLMREI